MVSEVCGLQRSMVLTSRQVVDSDVHSLQWGIWLVERFAIYSVVCVWLSCVVYCEVYLWQWGISFTVQYMVDIEVCDFQSGILLIIYFLYDKQWLYLLIYIWTGAAGSWEWHQLYVPWIQTDSGGCWGTSGWVQETALSPGAFVW